METALRFHSDPAVNFGVLTLKVPKVGDQPLTGQKVLFYNDISGSMDDPCADGRTKIQHAVHTTKNLWNMLAEKPGVTGGLYAFDDTVDTILPPHEITTENKAESIQKISGLMARGGTNIELALQHANGAISANEGLDVTVILMTDGNATNGCKDPETLRKLVHPQAKYVFIGYGIDHSAPMLATLSKGPNASYYFIDQIEKGGLVFGEVFNGIFSKRYAEVNLEGSEGSEGSGVEFYDFRTDTWVPRLSVGDLIGETERTFHLRHLKPPVEASISISISGRDISTGHTDQTGQSGLITRIDAALPPADLQKYIFRQRTQEAMFAAQKESANLTTKAQLKGVLAEIKAYMEKQLLTTDAFYISLCDDLAITIRTYGTEYGYMFATGRINSNGYERAYNICSLPPKGRGILRSCGISRNVRFSDALDAEEEEEEEDLNHTIGKEDVNLTRVTPSMGCAMRSASIGY